MDLKTGLSRCRKAAVPIVACRTPDLPAALRQAIELSEGRPTLIVDPISGIRAANKASREALRETLTDRSGPEPIALDASMAADPVAALTIAANAPADTIIIMLGGDRALAEPKPAIAALLLRDQFSRDGRTLLVLGSSWKPAAELGSDAVVLDDLPPSDAERSETASRMIADATLTVTGEELGRVVALTRGLARFPVEQAVAMAMDRSGLLFDVLEDNYREAVAQIPGMRVLSLGKGAGMEDVAGLVQLKLDCQRVADGIEVPDCLVFVDEVDKLFAGATGNTQDSSGATQAILGAVLTTMEQTKARGRLLAGPPGSGKSLCAVAMADVLKIPCLQFTPGDLKGGIVGDTERNCSRWSSAMRGMCSRPFYVFTANQIQYLPPELVRRTCDGVTMVDLPDPDVERPALFKLYMGKYNLTDPVPPSWASVWYSGADVRNVCRQAWCERRPLAEVMSEYVPAARSAMATIENLRRQAAGNWRSASYPGAYRMPAEEPTKPVEPTAGGRKVRV